MAVTWCILAGIVFITHAGCIAAGVGRALSRVCLFVCLSVCVSLFVCALIRKQLELSTLNLVHMYPIVVARHELTQRSKGQGHTVTKTVTVARLLVTRAAMAVCCCCQRGSACRYDCLCFIVNDVITSARACQKRPSSQEVCYDTFAKILIKIICCLS